MKEWEGVGRGARGEGEKKGPCGGVGGERILCLWRRKEWEGEGRGKVRKKTVRVRVIEAGEDLESNMSKERTLSLLQFTCNRPCYVIIT